MLMTGEAGDAMLIMGRGAWKGEAVGKLTLLDSVGNWHQRPACS